MPVRVGEGGGPLTSLIFPTYNPGAALEPTWRSVTRFLRGAPGRWEVLFVCDGCTDGSPERLAEWGAAERPRVRVLRHAPNRGKGYAVRRGLAEARGHWRIFADVDLAYDLDEVLHLARGLWRGDEVVIASRAHPDSRVLLAPGLQGYVYRRHLQSVLFSWLARLLVPVPQRDTQAGLKGLSARAADLVVPRLRCDGFGFDCELLLACQRLRIPVTEIPVCVRYTARGSSLNLRTAARVLGELLAIRRAWADVPPPAGVTDPVRRAA